MIISRYMKHLLIILLSFSAVFAQNIDTIKTYNSDEVVISANRSEVLIKNSASFLSVINSNQIQELNGNKLADKIITSPGIVFKDYGYGGLKTLSMRGMGSEHTLILYNGEKINSDQNGGCDLNNVLIDEVEKIEVIRGGGSAYYGASAIGGIINIIPKTKFEKFGLKAGFSYGAYNYQKVNLGTTGSFAGISYNLSYLKEQSDNDYKYKFDDGGSIFEGNRKNSAFDINQVSLNLNNRLSDKSSLNLYAKYLYADRDIPSIITVNIARANQVDKDLLSIINYKYNFGNFNFSVSPSFHYSSYNYSDPNLSDGISFVKGVSDFYRYGLSANSNILLSDNISSFAGVEVYHTNAECINYNDTKARDQFGVFYSAEINLFKNGLFPFIIYPALRYDYYSDFDGQFSPKIGFNVSLIPNILFVKSGYSDNFRAPTFNDLYWNPGGNPDLKPERSKSFDAGVSFYNDKIIQFNFDINYFYIYTKNRIFWMPYIGSIWKPKNVKDAKSKGIEANIEAFILDKAVKLYSNYSYTEAVNVTTGDINKGKLLPFIPKHNLQAGFTANYVNISLGFQFKFISSTYSEESNERLSKIDYYHLADAFIQYRTKIAGIETVFKLESNNIYNSEYVVIPYYPTPLRDYKLSININY